VNGRTQAREKFVLGETHAVEEKYHKREHCSFSQTSELLHQAAFGERSPLSTFYAEDVHTVSEKSVGSYIGHAFHPSNTLVVGSGIAHDVLVAKVQSKLTLESTKPAAASKASPFVGGEERVRVAGSSDTAVAVGFPIKLEDAKSFKVLVTVLQSRHPQARFFANIYHHGGLFGFFLETSGDHSTAALTAAINELKAVSTGPNAGEISNAKAQLTLKTLLDLESNHAPSTIIAAATTNTSITTIADYSGVTAETVAAAAGSALKANPALAVYGQTFNAPRHATLVSLLK